MALQTELPELLNIFTKIVCQRKAYCFICLRTSDERRLVKPESIQKFMTALKVCSSGHKLEICYICERQAHNALKMVRATVFASSLSRILLELLNRYIPNNEKLLETKFFKRILNKVKLSDKLMPTTIDEEVRFIRNNSLLSETDTLVMDNAETYETAPVYPQQVNAQTESNTSTIIHMPTCATPPSILPDRVIEQEEIEYKYEPHQDQLVILDDDDDPLNITNTDNQNTSTNINMTNVGNQSASTNINMTNMTNTQTTIIKNLADLSKHLVISTNPPNITSLQDLVNQQRIQTNLLLHPIFLGENGNLDVPTLSAVIANGKLIIRDTSNRIRHTVPINLNLDTVWQSLHGKQQVLLQHCDSFGHFALNTNLANMAAGDTCQSDVSGAKRQKTHDSNSGGMLRNILARNTSGNLFNKSTSSVNNIRISDISSDMNKLKTNNSGGDRTDWEDKIPMDVISFVDAVDPNAEESLKSLPPDNTMVIGQIRSLANQVPSVYDVIDLC